VTVRGFYHNFNNHVFMKTRNEIMSSARDVAIQRESVNVIANVMVTCDEESHENSPVRSGPVRCSRITPVGHSLPLSHSVLTACSL
jgi:hypothetical protein